VAEGAKSGETPWGKIVVGGAVAVIGVVASQVIPPLINPPPAPTPVPVVTVPATQYSGSVQLESTTCPDMRVGEFYGYAIVLKELGLPNERIAVGDLISVEDPTGLILAPRVRFTYPRFEFDGQGAGRAPEHYVLNWVSRTNALLRLEVRRTDGCSILYVEH